MVKVRERLQSLKETNVDCWWVTGDEQQCFSCFVDPPTHPPRPPPSILCGSITKSHYLYNQLKPLNYTQVISVSLIMSLLKPTGCTSEDSSMSFYGINNLANMYFVFVCQSVKKAALNTLIQCSKTITWKGSLCSKSHKNTT